MSISTGFVGRIGFQKDGLCHPERSAAKLKDLQRDAPSSRSFDCAQDDTIGNVFFRRHRVVWAVFWSLVFAAWPLAAAPCSPEEVQADDWSTRTGCIEVPEDPQRPEQGSLNLYYEFSQPRLPSMGTVLLFHGGPGYPRRHMNEYGEMWEGIRTHYAVLYFHQRGAGYSQRVARESDLQGKEHLYSLDTMVSDAHALVQQLVPSGKVVLMGKSAGGFLALKYALAHPDSVQSLIVACTTSHDEYLSKRSHVKTEFLQIIERRHGGFLKAWSKVVKRYNENLVSALPEPLRKTIPLLDILDGIVLDLSYTLEGQFEMVAIIQDTAAGRFGLLKQRVLAGRQTLVRSGLESIAILSLITCREFRYGRSSPDACSGIVEGPNYDLRNQLATIRKPTLVLGGRFDPILPPRFQEEIARGIGASAQLRILELSGHMVFLEQPRATSQIVLDFLQIPRQQPEQLPGL